MFGLIYFFFFLSGRCVSADAATDFCAFVDVLLRRILDAFVPTLFDVFSFFAMALFPFWLCFQRIAFYPSCACVVRCRHLTGGMRMMDKMLLN